MIMSALNFSRLLAIMRTTARSHATVSDRATLTAKSAIYLYSAIYLWIRVKIRLCLFIVPQSNLKVDTMLLVKTLKKWSRTTPNLLTKSLAEFVACMIFHFVGSVSPTPLTNATSLLVLVYYTARMSGAHLNPSLSLTFALLGYINPLELVVYWASQVAGCVFGALWIALLVPGMAIGRLPQSTDASGCFTSSPVLTSAQLVGWEAAGTFVFILPIFSVVWYTQHKSGYGNTGPIIVGVSLYAAASAVAAYTGAALNPARAVASSIVFRCPGASKAGLYVAGELIGGALVPLAIIPWYGLSSSYQTDAEVALSAASALAAAAIPNNSDDDDSSSSKRRQDVDNDGDHRAIVISPGSSPGSSPGRVSDELQRQQKLNETYEERLSTQATSRNRLRRLLLTFANASKGEETQYVCMARPRTSVDMNEGSSKYPRNSAAAAAAAIE